MQTNDHLETSRRQFLGNLSAGTAAVTLAGLFAPLQQLQAGENNKMNDYGVDADEWFKQLKGKHRVVFDATRPHEVMPFAWPRVFLLTNEATGTPANNCGVVLVLRHDAIPYAMKSELWSKYKFGEMFHAPDPKTNQPSTRNPFWQPAKGDFQFPGVGEVAIGINELQASGVMVCVCNAALTVYSSAYAAGNNLNAADVRKDWDAGLLPGIQVVPSGVWALGRAQEHGCAYIFAG
jgi:intracellular sulfur oxidation DsrE/DsrF family protein